jgi:hypothetical protein
VCVCEVYSAVCCVCVRLQSCMVMCGLCTVCVFQVLSVFCVFSVFMGTVLRVVCGGV